MEVDWMGSIDPHNHPSTDPHSAVLENPSIHIHKMSPIILPGLPKMLRLLVLPFKALVEFLLLLWFLCVRIPPPDVFIVQADDDLKKQRRPFLTQFFSPIFLKAFSITFFGEWGDKSQIATIGLAADQNPYGVVLGGIIGQALCTTAAVLGGKSLASQISEKMVALSGGILFLVFGVQSFLAAVGES